MPVFLNQYSSDLPITRPFEDVDPAILERNIRAALDQMPTNKEQEAALRQLCELHGHFAMIQGIPGAGRTTVICLITLLLLSLGYDVILYASTHHAQANLTEMTHKYLRKNPDPELNKIKPLHVHRPTHENDAASKTSFVDEAADVQEEIQNIEFEQLLSKILLKVKNDVRTKDYKHPDFSLQTRTFEFAEEAKDKGIQLMSSYNAKHDGDEPPARLYNADTGAPDKTESSPTSRSSPQVDMCEKLRGFKVLYI